MKVILLQDVKSIGRRYEEKNVSDGFAINSLIPKKLAVPATGNAAAQIKMLKEGEDASRARELEKLHAEMKKLSGMEVKVSLKANERGHLFASLTKETISSLLGDRGISVHPKAIKLASPIKEVGTFTIPVSVDSKETHFTLIVEAK